VHTAIEAVRLAGTTGGLPVTLDIIGSGDRGYAATLTEAVARNGLQKVVTFHGAIDHQNVPAILRTFHALLFPSEWDEPFPRVVLEAMASGLAVIGTSRGGTSEVLADEVTGLVFPAGDAPSLADRIRRLGDDAELRQRLVTEAYRRVRRDFNFERMVNDIESALAGLAGERPAAVSS
jgi:glycosyltransferase involved in cell wall biosynthesis